MAETDEDEFPDAPQDSAGAAFSIDSTISKLKRTLAQNAASATGRRHSAVVLDFETVGMDAGDDSTIDLIDEFSPSSSDENMVINLSDEDDKHKTRSEESVIAESALDDTAESMMIDAIKTGTAKVGKGSSEESGNPGIVKTVYSCNHCDYKARTHSGWNSHFKRRHPRLAQNCSSLLKHYSKVTTSSQKSRVPTLYFCQYCNYITLSMTGFIIHSSKVHPKKKAIPSKQGSPITTDSNKKYLEALYSSRDESPRTKSKVRQLLEKYHANSRILEEVPRFLSLQCMICKQDFSTAGLLGQHYETCHSTQGPKKNPITDLYHCKLCPFESLTRLPFYKHYIKNHHMDTFYAWDVPDEQSMLEEKSQFNGNSCDTLERLHDYLPFEVSWDVSSSKGQHIAGDDVPCVCCEFSSQNIVELLHHYHNVHSGLYPIGFGIFLIERLILHANPIYVPFTEVNIIDKDMGAWVSDNGQLIQYYKYECRLCDFKGDWFYTILNHFTEDHPSVNCCSLNVSRKVAEISSISIRARRFSQCIVCGFILMDSAEDTMLKHFENKHGGSGNDTFTTHSLTERRHCQDCDFIGNVDAMQWHCADAHFFHVLLWNNLKVDESRFMFGKEYSCRVCVFSSKTDWDLAFHYQEQHFQPAITFSKEEIFSITQYKCSVCNVTTSTLPEIITHHNTCIHSLLLSQSHRDSYKRFLSCNHCGRVFTTSVALWKHIIDHHCAILQLFGVDDLKEYTLKHGYWDSEHKSTVEYGKVQDDKMLLPHSVRRSRVMEQNGGNAVALMKITQKEKDTSSISGGSLSSGSITSTPTLKCKFCPFSTTLRCSLTHHLKSSHQHDGGLRCFGCEKRFSVITDCLQHHLHIHGLQISTETAYNFLLCDTVSAQHTSGKFLCGWCGFKGLSRLLVSNHINSKHVKGIFGRKKWKKNGPYSCQWCDYYTKNATSMRAHLSSKHERTVSYHSLTNFLSRATDTGKSSNSSDEDYSPSKRKSQSCQKSMKKPCLVLFSECRSIEDADCLFSEDLKSTHVYFKHGLKHPYMCRFCMKAFVCATTFLKHCSEEHTQWSSVSIVPQHVIIVPDLEEIAVVTELLKRDRNRTSSEDLQICISREYDWPCELCGSEFHSLSSLQQHARDGHPGKKLLLCRYCDFTSLTEKKIVAHSHLHVRMNGVQKEQHSSHNGRLGNDKDSSKSEDIVDLVMMESYPTKVTNQTIEVSEVSDDDEPELPLVQMQQKVSSVSTEVRSSYIQKARKSIRGASKIDSLSNQEISSFGSEDLFPEGHNASASPCENDITVESGLISCSKCDFSCTDAERMQTHIKSNHMRVDSYSCKFCDFATDMFATLDEHLAQFHKIERNHHFGLKVCSSAKADTSNTSSESRSRFLYTPMPSLPILREEVVYIQDNRVNDLTGASASLQHRNGHSLEDLKCSYCGCKADNTFILEMHMRRHESAFGEESAIGMNYRMTRMHMTSFS